MSQPTDGPRTVRPVQYFQDDPDTASYRTEKRLLPADQLLEEAEVPKDSSVTASVDTSVAPSRASLMDPAAAVRVAPEEPPPAQAVSTPTPTLPATQRTSRGSAGKTLPPA